MRKTKAKKRITKKQTSSTNNGRATGMTQISISLHQSIVDAVDKCAVAESRNRSNMIAKILTDYTK